MVFISFNLIPYIIGSGVGSCGDGCGIKVIGRRSVFIFTERIQEGAVGSFSCRDQILRVTIVSKLWSRCRSLRHIDVKGVGDHAPVVRLLVRACIVCGNIELLDRIVDRRAALIFVEVAPGVLPLICLSERHRFSQVLAIRLEPDPD